MFENMILGPVVAIDNSKGIREHTDDIISRGFIPVALVDDPENEVYKPFIKNEDFKKFKTVAVFVTVQYIKAYE